MGKTFQLPVLMLLALAIILSGYRLWIMSGEHVYEYAYNEQASGENSLNTGSLTPGVNETPAGSSNYAELAGTQEIIPGQPDEIPLGNPEYEYIKYEDKEISDPQNDKNGDPVGWLTIPGTKIDCPFAAAAGDDSCLAEGSAGNIGEAGALFLDCRCGADFRNFNTIIYGRNMKTESIYGGIKQFSDKRFFDTHKFGTIFLQDGAYTLEIFAYLAALAEDAVIYDASSDKERYFEYVKNNAVNYSEPGATEKVVTLSICPGGGLDDSGAALIGCVR
ncbi:MAG: class B sortase [Defluviitaleaceae bacterium]|nr:class B sortase [Defluviitaleaceae bacterium]